MVWASSFPMFETIPKEINLMDVIRIVKSGETRRYINLTSCMPPRCFEMGKLYFMAKLRSAALLSPTFTGEGRRFVFFELTCSCCPAHVRRPFGIGRRVVCLQAGSVQGAIQGSRTLTGIGDKCSFPSVFFPHLLSSGPTTLV